MSFQARNILAAVSAIDIELLQIMGRALGVPVYKLLGGTGRDKVTCHKHCIGTTVDELVESRHPGRWMPDAMSGQPRLETGCLLPLDKPGLGIEIDREALQRYPFEMTERPHFRREDGAVTNWQGAHFLEAWFWMT